MLVNLHISYHQKRSGNEQTQMSGPSHVANTVKYYHAIKQTHSISYILYNLKMELLKKKEP